MKQLPNDIYRAKHTVIKAIRNYFEKTGSIEVFTPYLNKFPNLDPNIYPVECTVEKSDGKKITAYLHTSPEYNMKKLLSKIKHDIHQICHVFRNFEGSDRHTVEFMMLEWYRLGYNLEDLMEDSKNIFIETALSLSGKPAVSFRGREYNIEKWEKITVDEAFYRYTGIYPDDFEGLVRFLKNSPTHHCISNDYETVFYTVYAFYVEPKLGIEKPTFIYDYPPQFSALAKIENGKGKRFEAYIGGVELINGYYEINNTTELRKRLEKDRNEKAKKGREYPVDEEFINSCKNIPEFSGASLGIDRLLMVLLNKEKIHEVQGLNWI
ncbi:elongation factor P--(R)-beta-lysine ligase [Persephonella atlantica]|uniref:Elongation factor P--(R)-beta-lysine ligase n=1 Tax=Persephonella atlantica TaxID=2699429 RepID=A0ABS1GFS8_9AQUI|nr:elongation factor P--(R)-beta-lysine ligase [Persephonella atlantica]MBK3331770.1 elongation factor P--(R)-beta-lysine ligase [Persephonella atlantica]